MAETSPRLVFWETTAGCNLRCIHCRRTEVSDAVMSDDLTTGESRTLIEQVASFDRPPILVLSGGEPLFRSDIFQLASYATSLGVTVALATNATLVDELVARRVAASGIQRVSVSLDAADAATHDAFRGVPGSFARAVEGISHLKAAGVPFQINSTVARHNVTQLPAMIALALRLGAAAFHPFLLVPVGCGVEIAGEQMIRPQEYEEVLNWLWEEEQKGLLEIKATCAPHYYRISRQRAAELRRHAPTPSTEAKHGHPGSMSAHTRGCLAGIGVCFISHRGQVFPCGYLPVEAGDVCRQSLQTIWNESPVFGRLRHVEALTGKCGVCEFERVCGGCRARAYGTSGDYMSEEPFCVYQPRRHASLIRQDQAASR
jgi:heme b synthase